VADRVVTPERFAQGMTFDDYVTFIGSPDNLRREGFDVRRFSTLRPRLDWSDYLRRRHAKARLIADQVEAIRWLAAQPGGPARVLVIAEEWSSDCRRDLPYLARLAEAGDLELRIFPRDADTMLTTGLPQPGSTPNADLVRAYANEKKEQQFATVPVAVFFDRDFRERYRYVEYPAIYRKERLFGHFRATRDGEAADAARLRAGREIGELFESPFFDVWARAAVDEILSALYERVVLGAA
jgi:thioredoxin family protein